MLTKQEVLRCIREIAAPRKVTMDTDLAELLEDLDDGLEGLIESLEDEFNIELPQESILEAETVGDLCYLVIQASAPPYPSGPTPEAHPSPPMNP
ncbi:MAG: hypothetical protein L6E13_07545 [Firmicutes bacterium]|nr:hypothetical protein [Bacillota bacterium]